MSTSLPRPSRVRSNSTVLICEEFEIDAIKNALERLSCGVCVVSARRGESINAMTVRMAMPVATRPPTIALSLRTRSLTCQYIGESGAFALSVLAQGQELLGGHFGLRSGRSVDKFVELRHRFACTGAPILVDCCAWFDCRVASVQRVGSQSLVVGEICEAGVEAKSRAPLVFRRSDYD